MRRFPELYVRTPGAFVLRNGGVNATKATLDISFTTGQAWNAGPVAITSMLSCSRASAGYYTDLSGTLTSYPTNTLRMGNRGLLVEGARTNLALQSQTLGTTWASGGTGGATVVSNTTAAPDGTLTADTITFGANPDPGYRFQSWAPGASTLYTFSVYAKTASGTKGFRFKAFDGVGDNLSSNQTATTDWQRFTSTFTTAGGASGTQDFGFIDLATGVGGDLIVWGAQLEVSTATYGASSYIPTTTVSVTRALDVVTFADLTWFDGTSTSIYAEWTARNIASAAVWLFDAANDITVNEQTGMSPRLSDAGATVSLTTATTVAADAVARAAGRMKTNDYAFCLNGGTVATDTSATQPGTLAASRLGVDLAGANPLNGYIRRVSAWKTLQLTDAELQARTV